VTCRAGFRHWGNLMVLKAWRCGFSSTVFYRHLSPNLTNQQEQSMPKMKTKSGAKKRLKVLGNGGVKRSMAFKRHILTKKTTKTKRQLRGTVMVHSTNMAAVRAMLPYA
jgi:large subunit ribosomal protein L35